jgi:hypothetical protein
MIRFGYPYFGKKFLYDVTTNTIHSLVNEKDECKIEEIDVDDVDMYSSLDETCLILDHPVFKPCPHCMNSDK